MVKVMDFNGLGMNQGNLSRLSNALSRSISPENFTGEAGKGGMAVDGTNKECAANLGQGWKVSPSIDIEGGETFTLANINGMVAIITSANFQSMMRVMTDPPSSRMGARMPILCIMPTKFCTL